MTIEYPKKRSSFVDPIRSGIAQNRIRLEDGESVEIVLGPGGYPGEWVVTIDADDPTAFDAFVMLSDPSRFPQRIKVAAWALHLESMFGRFAIAHSPATGVVLIRRDG